MCSGNYRYGHIFIFSWNKYNFMHFERHFKMHKIMFFLENLKKILVSPVNLGRVGLP